jgi:bacterioferritin-associated ferredoxin
MIRCICNNISDQDIEKYAKSHGVTLAQAAEALGMGTCCGSCLQQDMCPNCGMNMKYQVSCMTCTRFPE